ncbi:MAG: SDR family NAD(P)-dependent oxidoreductase [Burkholderiaceae bacterium]
MTAPVDLSGRTAIVTGAGKGLGRAYVLYLAACGAAVLVNNRRHPGESDAATSAAQTVAAIEQRGGRALANWCDVCEPDSGQAMVEQARAAFGGLDIVVANAGIATAGSFLKQGMAEFRKVFDTGFLGNLHLAHAAWPHLMAQGYGRVTLTASSAGLYADHGLSAYSASKAAVIGLARALAQEGRRKNVMVNVIAPYGLSQMTAGHMSDSMAQAFDPALVAPLVGWLSSPACDLSGEVLVSGGGMVRRNGTGETDGVLLPPDDVGGAVHGLQDKPVHTYAGASESFASFVRELENLKKVSIP